MSAAARPPEVIDLQRLHLRRPRLTDAAAIFEYASDPDVARYADWPISKSIESVSVPSVWRLSATCDVENLASARAGAGVL